MYKFESQFVENGISPIKHAEECFRQARDTLNKKNITSLAAELDTQGSLASAKKSIVSAIKWTQRLQADIKATIADYEELSAKGKNSLLFQGDRFSYGTFASAAGLASAAGYAGYQIYQFESSGKSLISDYNDMYAFRSSSLYKSGQFSVNMSKWDDYVLMGGVLLESMGLYENATKEYTDGLLESAIASIVNSMPDLQSVGKFDTLDQLGEYTGIDNMDKWVSALKSVLTAYAKAKEPFDKIQMDKDYMKLINQLPPSVREMFETAVGSIYGSDLIGKDLSKATEVIERIEICIDVIMHSLNNYSVQVSYLETWENAMLEAGLNGGPVLAKLQELKETYQMDVGEYLEKTIFDVVTKEAVKTSKKEIIKAAAESYPAVQWVDLGLSLSSTVTKLQYADDISAVQGLDGLYMLDQNLTTSYQNYVDLMQEGIATEADMQEAERLFNLLKQTKIKEYSHMLTLCEGHDINLFNQYHAKYFELTGETWGDYTATCIWHW